MTVWVYKMFEPGLYTVGFYSPSGEWEPVADHDSRDAAEQHVHYLNGGVKPDGSA